VRWTKGHGRKPSRAARSLLLLSMSVGDTVDISYSEALAIEVEKAPTK
jgi:hypothetical protein